MARSAAKPPIFILGVPRSGTTLLRTILDSHPSIACGPETPWLGGHQPRSVMELWRFLRDDKHGYTASYGMSPALVTSAARDFVDRLLGEYAQFKGKQRWAEKTPDNALYVDFLLELFPEAKFVHLVRDGLDVALSTSVVEVHRKGVSVFHERFVSLGPGVPPIANTPFAALLRWRHWDSLIERSLVGKDHLRLTYERLVTEPEPALRSLTEFIGERFTPAMLEYRKHPHDYPAWEWGSADVQSRDTIRRDRVGRAKRELSADDRAILAPMADPSGEPPSPMAFLASVDEVDSTRFTRFMEWLNAFAGPLGLQQFTNWSKSWEYPKLWLGVLDAIDWRRTRLADLGTALSPMPWVCALLGAKVTLVETRDRFVPVWTALRDKLRVDVSWLIADSERIPLESDAADVLSSFSVLEHQPDKRSAMDEAARVLRPGGTLALSFDVCEPEQGMTFPEWNGEAMTLRQFEETIWLHPWFGNTARPAWNTADIPAFLNWHRRSAPHHNYVVGAAILRKKPA